MSHQMRNAVSPRRIAAMVVTTAMVVLLAGCSFAPKGGENMKAAKTPIEQIDGVQSVLVDSSHDVNSAHSGTSVVVVTVAPGYRVGDATQALNWILEAAWSINDHKIDQGVTVGFVGVDGKPLDWGWQNAASQLGVAAPAQLDYLGDLYFLASALAEKYGPWPGKVPVAPQDLFVEN
jgi:hypothetical protein